MKKERSDKKAAERVMLDQLIRIYPEFPAGKIEASESPDFIVQSGPKWRMGVELTQYGRPGDFRKLSRDFLEEVIRSKEEKLVLYRRKKFRQIWLIIVAEGFGNAASFNISNQIENWKIGSEFDRVVIVDLRKDRAYTL